MRIKIDGALMCGDYAKWQIKKMKLEFFKPKYQREYIFGIDFGFVNTFEVLKDE